METKTVASHAASNPGKPAVIMANGSTTTYAAIDANANQGAHLIRSLGLQTGDCLALCMDNTPEFLSVACAAARSGIVLVPISSKLTIREIVFILNDSEATMLVTSPSIGDTFAQLPKATAGVILFSIGPTVEHYRSWDSETSVRSTLPIKDESPGTQMLYSSGTTGRPKGIRYIGTGAGVTNSVLGVMERMGLTTEMVYLSSAPLYHSAPFAWAMATLRMGGTVIVMERFDPEQALSLIERHHITVSQWVPTHFVRMLKLPDVVRKRYDTSSLKLAVHSAAPCPVLVKQAMIDWWGPIIFEYFGSSEQTVLTLISSEEWLLHPGSVGRSVTGTVHICDDQGEPLPRGTVGRIYSEGGSNFLYHRDEEKSRLARNGRGWTTVGDIGYLNESDYLFITGRESFTIITGGVNVYPQEIEDMLVTHARVADVAVIGLSDTDLGEIVVAVVQPINMADATPAFADELKRWLREGLSGVKVPRLIEFRSELPRLPTGKMVKHKLQEQLSGLQRLKESPDIAQTSVTCSNLPLTE